MSQVSPLSDILTDLSAPGVGAESSCTEGLATSVNDQVTAASTAAIVADVSGWGHFRLGGKDGIKYLQGLVTNDVAKLEPGTGCRAAFLNVHGRFEAIANIFRGDESLLLQTPPEATAWVDTFLSRYRHAGDFQFSRIEGLAACTVQGPLAGRHLSAVLGGSFVPSTELTCTTVTFDGELVWVLGVRRSVAGGFDVVGPSACIARIVEQLLRTAHDQLTPAGAEALDTVRMEAGIAAFQRDYDSDTVLQEIDQPDIVSFHKGCYLGQEIVARIHFQGQPSKLLRRLIVSADDVPAVGAELVAAGDDKPAGRVTSVAISPSLVPVVFAMVKRKYYAPGTTVRLARNDGFAVATVAERNPATGSERAE